MECVSLRKCGCNSVVNNVTWSVYIGSLWPTMYWKNTTACLQQQKTHTGPNRVPQNCSNYLTSTCLWWL